MSSVSIDMPLRWSGESRFGNRSYRVESRPGDPGVSIARRLLSHSLVTRLILFGRLIPAYGYGEDKRYSSDIICTVIQSKWYKYWDKMRSIFRLLKCWRPRKSVTYPIKVSKQVTRPNRAFSPATRRPLLFRHLHSVPAYPSDERGLCRSERIGH